jgi:hypothetical protein
VRRFGILDNIEVLVVPEEQEYFLLTLTIKLILKIKES